MTVNSKDHTSRGVGTPGDCRCLSRSPTETSALGPQPFALARAIGYPSAIAALTLSLVYGFTSVGKVLMGVFADRTRVRIALMANF